jgi:hypothetical protein
MSDLQLSLLIIGVIVVGGVGAYNWYQQWRLRRAIEHGIAEKHEDMLARERTPRDVSPRIEPQIGRREPVGTSDSERTGNVPDAMVEAQEASALTAAVPPVPGFDPAMDYIVSIDAQEPISAAGLAELHTRAAACGRRFRVAGYNENEDTWEEAARLGGGRYAHLKLALQLVNRGGVVDKAALASFCAAARECAERFGARATCPDVDAALATAHELDAFCSDVDIAIGVNIVAADGKFQGTRIRSLAEAAGFRLEPHGEFHYRDAAHHTLFTLDNHEPAPFLPEQVKQLSTTGVTLLLDVPRVADGSATLERMLKIGGELAQELGGSLVDDNRVPLNDKAVQAIQQQLRQIHGRMEAHGMPPGSERALRLFS